MHDTAPNEQAIHFHGKVRYGFLRRLHDQESRSTSTEMRTTCLRIHQNIVSTFDVTRLLVSSPARPERRIYLERFGVEFENLGISQLHDEPPVRLPVQNLPE